MNKKTFIFLAEGFEEIEAVTIIDVLRRANIDITSVSLQKELDVLGAHNIFVKADILYDQVKDFNSDMIILPGGGLGVDNLKKHEKLGELLKEYAKNDKNIGAICAAPMVLGKYNILDDRYATTFPGTEKETGANILDNNVVIDKNIITSKGPSTSMEFAVEIIEFLLGEEKRTEIEKDLLLK